MCIVDWCEVKGWIINFFFPPTCLVTTWREKIRETENQFGLALLYTIVYYTWEYTVFFQVFSPLQNIKMLCIASQATVFACKGVPFTID